MALEKMSAVLLERVIGVLDVGSGSAANWIVPSRTVMGPRMMLLGLGRDSVPAPIW